MKTTSARVYLVYSWYGRFAHNNPGDKREWEKDRHHELEEADVEVGIEAVRPAGDVP